MDKPLVSLIIPTRNNSATLSRCLKSALEQDYENLLILAVDNRSDDNTYDILWDFEKNNRERLYTGRTFDRLSPNGHRELCLKLLSKKTQFVQFLPPTDVLFPNCISRCVDLCGSNEYVGCVLTHADIVHPSGRIDPAPAHRPCDCVIPGDTEMEFFMANGLELNAARFFRRDIYRLSRKEGFIFNRFPDWLPLIAASSISDIGYISEVLALRGDWKAIAADEFVPALDEIFEHYLFLHAFNDIAARLARPKVCEKFPTALRRLSLECIRCAVRLSKTGDIQNARAYLSLSLAYLPEIAQTQDFQQAARSFENRVKDWL